jgi:hypothetical protein
LFLGNGFECESSTTEKLIALTTGAIARLGFHDDGDLRSVAIDIRQTGELLIARA